MEITELFSNQGIICSTEAEAEIICQFMDKCGLLSISGHSMRDWSSKFYEKTSMGGLVLYPDDGQHGDLHDAVRKNRETFPASLFINHQKTYELWK